MQVVMGGGERKKERREREVRILRKHAKSEF